MPAKFATLCSLVATALFSFSALSQTVQAPAAANDRPAAAALATDPWEIGGFFQGGVGVGDRSDFHFTSAGVRLGKVITDQHLKGIFRGQFEYAGELMPYWQAFTPAPHTQVVSYSTSDGTTEYYPAPVGGGKYTGLSITPIILRWDLKPTARIAPWVQGAGGLIWTNHKFPPDFLVQEGQPGGTSVFNFTPQFGIGLHYFIKDRRSIDFAANAIHISSASLGDHNPGVNASVQFQIGYTWWK